MKNIKRPQSIIGIILLIFILNGCNAYKSIDIGDIENVNFKGMVNSKISLELSIPITNPNGYKIKIKSMDLDVSIDGKYLGKLKNTNEIIIPAKSDEVQNILVDIHIKNMLSGMSSFYKISNSKSFKMQIEGTIKAKAFLSSKTIKVSEIQDVSL